jgi:uncharacterized protein YndB with AHSA1/START domain
MKNEYRVRVSEFIEANQKRVFEAWTDPAQMKKWFCPEGLRTGSYEADVRINGKFRAEMIGAEGTFTAIGVYKEIIPYEKLVFTHSWEGPDWQETLVTVEFHKKDGGTEVTVTHEKLPSADSAKGHEQGWEGTLQHFKHWLTETLEAPHGG